MGPKIGAILGRFLTFVRPILGSILGQEWTKRRQEGLDEDIKSLKAPKSIIFKMCDFGIGKPDFSRFGGSQDEHKRLRKAPKRHLKSFKTSKMKIVRENGAEMDPEIDQQTKTEMEPKLELHQVNRNGDGKCKYCKVWLQVQVQIMSDK